MSTSAQQAPLHQSQTPSPTNHSSPSKTQPTNSGPPISKGRKLSPPRIFIYGTKGIGKTSLLIEAKNSLLVDAEGGSDQLDVNARVEQQYVNTWDKLQRFTELLCTDPAYAEFKIIGFDTADWIEKLCWRYCIARDKPKSKGDYDLEASIEAYGFGKGYEVAADEFRKWLMRLEKLRSTGRAIVLIGHSLTKKVINPLGEDYEQYRPSIHEKVSSLISGWCDIYAFCQFQVVTTRASKFARAKAANPEAEGTRWLYTAQSPAFEAKSRYLMPKRMQLNAGDFWSALERGMAEDAGMIRRKIEAVVSDLKDKDTVTKVKEFVAKAGDNANALHRAYERCLSLLQQQQEQEAQEQAKREAEAEASGEALPKPVEEEGPPEDVELPTFQPDNE